ncbi:MAG: type II toxin-antitoxin system ParD family antitoxin [Candidatus Diapherotrites archaeon]|nr:type II toxin-antitoxin system ParD family antitoxin [Candidatus Diapherotrites archaeon]
MTTLSADVTMQMQKWIDGKVKVGLYKSRSEVVRGLLREKMEEENYPKAALSAKVLEKVWNNKSDDIWESYL